MSIAEKITIYSWNINGVRAALNKGLLQSFVEKHNPDILCLQEIRAHESEAELDFPQYIEYWNTAAKRGYAGTAIFTRRDPLHVTNNLAAHLGEVNNEGRVITAEYPHFWLVTAYAPNTKPDLSRLKLRCEVWDPFFLSYCKELEKTKPVVICGDLNVAHTEDDLVHPDKHEGKNGFTQGERAGFEKLLDAGFIDTFRMFHKGNGLYTWWTNFSNSRARNLGWRIDYFLVSGSLMQNVIAADIHPDVMGSDHCPVSLTLRLA